MNPWTFLAQSNKSYFLVHILKLSETLKNIFDNFSLFMYRS